MSLFPLSTSAKYMCSDTLRHYALLLNSSHEPLAIYMISNNRKKCLGWKWNSIFDYHYIKSINSIFTTQLENCPFSIVTDNSS